MMLKCCCMTMTIRCFISVGSPAFSEVFGNSRASFLTDRLYATMSNPDWKTATSVHEFTARDLSGQEVKLEKYKGHVCIIVNVASKCGFTGNNYKEFNEMYDKYAESKGLRILAFPCNQFMNQEPGGSEEIACTIAERKIKFDMFEKINVNGKDAHPLWKFLKHKKGGFLVDGIKWNFTKFVVDKDGVPVERFGPNTDPMKLIPTLEKLW